MPFYSRYDIARERLNKKNQLNNTVLANKERLVHSFEQGQKDIIKKQEAKQKSQLKYSKIVE